MKSKVSIILYSLCRVGNQFTENCYWEEETFPLNSHLSFCPFTLFPYFCEIPHSSYEKDYPH